MTGDAPSRSSEQRSRLAALLAAGGTPESVAAALERQPDVVSASTRPGLVKTEPPLVELVVGWREDTGHVRSRVYDVAVRPDGGLVLGGEHEA
ncbi:hypothetical protein ACI8AC_10120 [Geodermatophilus sp. SYSU D00758]